MVDASGLRSCSARPRLGGSDPRLVLGHPPGVSARYVTRAPPPSGTPDTTGPRPRAPRGLPARRAASSGEMRAARGRVRPPAAPPASSAPAAPAARHRSPARAVRVAPVSVLRSAPFLAVRRGGVEGSPLFHPLQRPGPYLVNKPAYVSVKGWSGSGFLRLFFAATLHDPVGKEDRGGGNDDEEEEGEEEPGEGREDGERLCDHYRPPPVTGGQVSGVIFWSRVMQPLIRYPGSSALRAVSRA